MFAKALVVSLLTLALAAVPGTAQAQQVTLVDPPGDKTQAGLDITRAKFANRDRAVVATVTFVRDRPGAVFIGVQGRHGRILAVVESRHHRQGPDEVAFEDGDRCRGLSSTWNRATATIRVRIPSRCVARDGDYGALRFAAATLPLHNADDVAVDYVPDTAGEEQFSALVPRG